MDGWWSEIEDEILNWLRQHGELTPSELGRHMRISEGATASLLAMMASEGKVSIRSVTLGRDGSPPPTLRRNRRRVGSARAASAANRR